jgi:tetratricopeptide (TPR) repeat protein
VQKALPDAPVVLAEAGRLHLAKNDTKQARTAFEGALAKDPSLLDAITGQVAVDLQEKNSAQARAHVEAAVARSPRNDAIQVLAAQTYMAIGDSPAAEQALKQALALNPKSLQVYGLLAQLYMSERRIGDAAAEYVKLAAERPQDATVQTTTAFLLYVQNKQSEARAYYQKALQADPRAVVAANNMAWMYAESGENLDVALNLAQTAKQQLPDSPEINDTLGWVNYKKGLYTLAVGPLQEAVKKDPTNPTYHLHLGLALAGTGDKVKSRQSLERALTLKLSPADAATAQKALATLAH